MKFSNIDTDKTVFIVAEIGNNHEGNFSVAQKMISSAANAQADAVKFQTFIPEYYCDALNLERRSILKKFQLTFSQFEKLARQAQQEKKEIYKSLAFKKWHSLWQARLSRNSKPWSVDILGKRLGRSVQGDIKNFRSDMNDVIHRDKKYYDTFSEYEKIRKPLPSYLIKPL